MTTHITWYETPLVAKRDSKDNLHSYHDQVEQFANLNPIGYSVTIQDDRYVSLNMRHKTAVLPSSVKQSVTISAGSELSVSGVICVLATKGAKKADHENGRPARKAVTTEISEDRLDDWLINAFGQKGLEVDAKDLIYTDTENLAVVKPNGQRFFFPVRRVWVKGVVTDEKLVETLFMKGIGKRRAYGAGVMYVD